MESTPDGGSSSQGDSGPSAQSDGGADPLGDAGASEDAGTTTFAISPDCVQGGAGVTYNGWTMVITNDFVAAKNGDVIVAIAYSLSIDDGLRAADHLAEGVWDRLIGDEYTAGPRTSGGDGFGLIAYSSGPATENATGASVFIAVSVERHNGTALPVIAVAPDEATLRALLPTPESVAEMRRYNAFPLRCATLGGRWTSSSVDAYNTYDVFGFFTGLVVSALRFDASFDSATHYTFRAKVTTNTGSQNEVDEGTYAATDTTIHLTSSAGFRDKTYDASFVGVRGGIALYIVDEQFSGDAWLLLRAP